MRWCVGYLSSSLLCVFGCSFMKSMLVLMVSSQRSVLEHLHAGSTIQYMYVQY